MRRAGHGEMGCGQRPGGERRRRDLSSKSVIVQPPYYVCFFQWVFLTDTDTGTTETDGSGTHADVLGDLDEGVGHLRGVGTLGLGGDLGAGGVHEGGGALHGVEGRGLAGGDYITRACQWDCPGYACSFDDGWSCSSMNVLPPE